MDTDSDLSGIRWPRSDTSLFGIAGDLIAETPASGKEWGRFADAYLMAAESVVRNLESAETDDKESPTRIDYLVFPVLYLYRHFVELRLKEIIIAGQDLARDKNPWTQNHDLNALWRHARRILVTVFPNDPVEDLDNTERLIQSIYEVDPGSFAFGYPTVRNSEEQYDFGHEKLSIQQFSEGMTKLALFLGTVAYAISHYSDVGNQSEREARSLD